MTDTIYTPDGVPLPLHPTQLYQVRSHGDGKIEIFGNPDEPAIEVESVTELFSKAQRDKLGPATETRLKRARRIGRAVSIGSAFFEGTVDYEESLNKFEETLHHLGQIPGMEEVHEGLEASRQAAIRKWQELCRIKANSLNYDMSVDSHEYWVGLHQRSGGSVNVGAARLLGFFVANKDIAPIPGVILQGQGGVVGTVPVGYQTDGAYI